MWDMTHSYWRHDSFICDITLNLSAVALVKRGVCHDLFVCETWLIHIWVMTHSHLSHDSFVCETWLIRMWDMTHSHLSHDSFVCGTWLIHKWHHDQSLCHGSSQTRVRHDSSIRETWLIHKCDDKFVCQTWLMRTWDMTHSYETSRSISLLVDASQWSPGYSVRDFWICDIWFVTLEWLSQ